MSRKSFTVEEANALIPSLREVFRGIGYYKSRIRERGRKLEVLNLLWSEDITDSSNPDHEDFSAHKSAIARDVGEIERLIREEIVPLGLRFPTGGIESGLVDFPTTYEGRWVYLCWQNGEPELLYWHETDGGFPGRRRLTNEQKRLMGRKDDPDSVDDSALDF
ncbi:MAG: DUF2203 domain-containing protein [Candidatus Latescibacterota bacterium]|jgi:hypothetical protein